jgi:tripartite-type tricarboxylate transporter receptor subunit TctC
MCATRPCILVVHPSLPVRSVKERVALAKAKPGTLAFGSQGLEKLVSAARIVIQ